MGRLGEVAVGLPIAEGAADDGHEPVEVDGVARAQRCVRWAIDLEQAEPPSGPEDAGDLPEHGRDGGKVAEGEAGDGGVERAGGEGEPLGVALDEGRVRQVAAPRLVEHRASEVQRGHVRACAPGDLGEVARAGGEVEDAIVRADGETANEPAPPALVEAQREQPVHAVVRRRDAVEHAPHGDGLLLGLGEAAHGAIVAGGGANVQSGRSRTPLGEEA